MYTSIEHSNEKTCNLSERTNILDMTESEG